MTHLDQCIKLNQEDPEAFRANALEMYNIAAKSGNFDVTEYIDDTIVTLHRRKSLEQCIKQIHNEEFRDNAYMFLKDACRRGNSQVANFIISNVPEYRYNWANLLAVSMRSGNAELCDIIVKYMTPQTCRFTFTITKWTPLSICEWVCNRRYKSQKYMFWLGVEYARIDMCARFVSPSMMKGRILRAVLEKNNNKLLTWLITYCPSINVSTDDLVYSVSKCSYKICNTVYGLWNRANNVNDDDIKKLKKVCAIKQNRNAQLISHYCVPKKSMFDYFKFW
jgi:hypothetical protein